LHMARLAKGSGIRMFVYVSLLGAVVAALFANDGAALILTPIVLAMVRNLNFNEKMIFPFIMASGFIADTTSFLFIVINLVNVFPAYLFCSGSVEYAAPMIIPDIASPGATIRVSLIYCRKNSPRSQDVSKLSRPKDAIRYHKLFRLS